MTLLTCKVQCVGICDERCLFPKKFYDLLFVFSSVFETPLFRLTNRRIASKLQTWWKKEDAGRGTLTNWYVFAQLSQKFWGRIWILIQFVITKRNDRRVSNSKDESFLSLNVWYFFLKATFHLKKKSSSLFAFGLVDFFCLIDLTLYASVIRYRK